MASRSTRRPITPLWPSICSIVSAGTRRLRREKRPERTESASGTSGAVPYIGHSTFPMIRPFLSATMYPAVLRRSIATALTCPTLFPPCKLSCSGEVKGLLTARASELTGSVLRRGRAKSYLCDNPRGGGTGPPPAAADARGRAQRPDAAAARVQRSGDRAALRDRGPGRADDRARAALRTGTAARGGAGGAGTDLRGGVGVPLPRGVPRGDREDDDGHRVRDGRGAGPRRRQDRVAGRACRQARDPAPAALEAAADRRAGLPPRHAVHGRGAGAAGGDRPPRGGRARARADRDARRAGPGDPSSRQEQPADDGPGPTGPSGTGLSIVHALVRDELQGSFELRQDGGTRAEVVFPA